MTATHEWNPRIKSVKKKKKTLFNMALITWHEYGDLIHPFTFVYTLFCFIWWCQFFICLSFILLFRHFSAFIIIFHTHIHHFGVLFQSQCSSFFHIKWTFIIIVSVLMQWNFFLLISNIFNLLKNYHFLLLLL